MHARCCTHHTHRTRRSGASGAAAIVAKATATECRESASSVAATPGSVKVSAVRVSWRDIALYRVRFGDRIESLGCDSIVLNERALQLYAQRLR